jgi:hypothetical protein
VRDVVIEFGPKTTAKRIGYRRRPVREHDVVQLPDGSWEVRWMGRTAGYVWQAGRIWVAAEGPNPAAACEVGQSLIWEVAIAMVEREHRVRGS